jgi:raffinose/stachyose/melibiose transport system substrate-binding protein
VKANFLAKTNTTVNVTMTNGTVEDGTVPTALKSGVGPDLVYMSSGPGRVGFLAQAGLLRALDDFYAQVAMPNRLYPFVMDLLHREGQVIQGKIWEIPDTLDCIYWNYNKDLFANAGIKPPTTLDDLISNYEKLKSGGAYPITLGVRSGYAGGWLFGNLLEAAAGTDGVSQLIYGDGKWDQPAMVQAAQTLQDWVKKQYIPAAAVTLTDDQAIPLFINKKAATYCVGTWFIQTMHDQKADATNVDTYPMPPLTPAGKALPTGGFGSSWVVAANAKNLDTALKFLDYHESNDVVALRYADPASGDITAVKAPSDIKPTPLLAKAMGILQQSGTGYNPSVYILATIKDAYYNAIQGLLTGQIAPDKAMASIQAAKVKAQQA